MLTGHHSLRRRCYDRKRPPVNDEAHHYHAKYGAAVLSQSAPHNVFFPPLPGPSLHDSPDDQQTMIGYRMGIYLSLSPFRLSLCNALLLVAMTATSKCVPADRSVDPVLLRLSVAPSVPSVFRLGCNDLGCPSAPMSRLPVGIISFPPPESTFFSSFS